MTPPTSLVKALAAYDPLLRLRFAEASQIWLIERRMPPRAPEFLAALRPPTSIAATEDHALVRAAHDRYDSLRAGYFPLFSIPPAQIHETDRLMGALRAMDAQAQGGFAAINAALDAEHAQWYAAKERERHNATHALAGEAADFVMLRNKQRVFVPESITAESG